MARERSNILDRTNDPPPPWLDKFLLKKVRASESAIRLLNSKEYKILLAKAPKNIQRQLLFLTQ